jgi:hypothetical protein
VGSEEFAMLGDRMRRVLSVSFVELNAVFDLGDIALRSWCFDAWGRMVEGRVFVWEMMRRVGG